MKKLQISLYKKFTSGFVTWAIAGVMIVSVNARAQGIPVYDNAAVFQAILQLQAWEQQFRQMQSTIQQQQEQLKSINGSRGLGTVNNAITNTILPPNIAQQVGAAQTHDALNSLATTNFQALSAALQTRSAQIQSLMSQINATNDPKSIQELSGLKLTCVTYRSRPTTSPASFSMGSAVT